jgi:hypothetical protein
MRQALLGPEVVARFKELGAERVAARLKPSMR